MTAHAIIDWGIHTGLAVTLLIVFVLLIRRPFARLLGAGAAYSLWSLPVIRLFLPEFNLTLPKALSDKFSITKTTDVSEAVNDTISATPRMTETFQSPTFQIPWIQILLTLWIGGAALWLAYHLLQHIRIKRSLSENSTALPSALEPIAYQAKRQIGMKREVNIRVSSQQTGPLVIGSLKPLIILPQGFMSDYSRRQQHNALAHELAHIKRGDLWMASLALLFRALNWPNPLIHFAAGKFRADQEAACDAYVLARLGGTQDIREGYAETLVHAAKHTLQLTPTPLGLTIHHPLKERLMTMKTSNKRPGFATRALASACLISALAIAAPFNVASAGDEKLAGEAHMKTEVNSKTEGRQVIQWVQTNDDGEQTEKHYEIITKDGQKTAYKISKTGKRTKVPLSEVSDIPHMPHVALPPKPPMANMDDMDVFITESDDGSEKTVIKKRVKVITSDHHGPNTHDQHGDDHKRVVIKNLKNGQHSTNTQVYTFSSDDITLDMEGEGFAHGHGGSHSKMMVGVAADMLENVNEDDMSAKAKRKLDKARKALKEAQDALENEK